MDKNTGEISIQRRLQVPDSLRVSRCRRSPELGPRIVFLSGGGALHKVCRRLKELTHNSVHLITPFDSGGSSAKLREAFDMISIGDLRARMVALADESALANPAVYQYFRFRFSDEAPQRNILVELSQGRHALMQDLPDDTARFFQRCLTKLLAEMPDDFDLRRASLGNLTIAGAYLVYDRDIDSVIMVFSRIMRVLGKVLPSSRLPLHLAGVLESGKRLLGQHKLTGKECPPLQSAITELQLVDGLTEGQPKEVEADRVTCDEISKADLICFPMGSFYTSVIANLLPKGVGKAIAHAGCPKVFIPSTGQDPEQVDKTVAGSIRELVRYANASAPSELLHTVVLDSNPESYPNGIEEASIRDMGIQVVSMRLVTKASKPHIDPELLAQVLVSLA